VITCKTN